MIQQSVVRYSNLVAACTFMSATLAFSQEKPNVIIIYTDDQGAKDMGCYGATDLYTPNMDALAERGVRFTQFYAAPISSPSRASLMSGQFTRRSGLWHNAGGGGLPLEKETLADRMKANGYATGLIGKWHLGDNKESLPRQRGFDYFFGITGGCVDNYSHFYYWGGPNKHDLYRNNHEVFYDGQYLSDLMIRELKNFVHDHQKEPFFLYWATTLPHYPLQGKAKWLDYYRNLPYPRNLYAAFISTLDEAIGEVMTFLKAENLLENTIIILQSDNGHSVEDRTHRGGGHAGEYRGAKFSLFEGGIRMPAIISWPGKIPEGAVRDQMAMNIDWFPTIVDLCNISSENMDVDGKSLVPVIYNADAPSQHEVLYFDSVNYWAVRKGDWKLLGNPFDPVNPKSIPEGTKLFLTNLKKNISETINFADDYPQIVEELFHLREDYVKKCNAQK